MTNTLAPQDMREIRELLSLRMKPGSGRAAIRARADAKIADVDQKIRTLQAIKKALRSLTDRCDGCGPIAECPILESLDNDDTRILCPVALPTEVGSTK